MIRLAITSSDLNGLVKLSAGAAVLAAALMLFLRWDLLPKYPLMVVFQVVSAGLATPTFVVLLVKKVPWKYPWLAKLLGRRMVHGLWWGDLKSNYIAPDGRAVSQPIEIAFVIRQTFFNISIKSYTADIPGESVLETLHAHPVTGDANLRYVYEMIRWANNENKAIRGYGDLVLGGGDGELSGDYWTNSPSAGRINLKLVTRECADIRSFAEAKAQKKLQVRWPPT